MRRNKIQEASSFLEKGVLFLNENPKITEGFSRTYLYNDEPKVYYYVCYFKDKYSKNYSEDSVAAGVSFNKERALLKLFGETIERYALTINNNKKLIYGNYSSLKEIYKNILNPLDVFSFSKKQMKGLKLNKKNLLSTKLHWVKGSSLLTNKHILIPAQLVFTPYVYQNSEPLIMWPLSTGAAAGQTLEDALLNGICEVVERDAFMIAYLNKLPCAKIDLNHLKNKKLQQILDNLSRYNIEVHIIDITTDLKILAVAAILIDRTGQGPAVTVGLKAGLDVYDVIVGAIEEAIMLRTWIRDKFIYQDPEYKRKKVIQTIYDRAHYWFGVESIDHLDFWLKSKKLKIIEPKTLSSSQECLDKILKLLKQKNINVIYFNLTDKTIEKYKYKIVKVIIPALQPLYLDDFYPYFGKLRLYETPVNMKIFNRPKKENQLNKIPHPFL
ncbi:MAG: YcaO-like family protein [Patescibacteria group bacterium]